MPDPTPRPVDVPDEAIEAAAYAMQKHYIDLSIKSSDGYDHCVCGSWGSDMMSEGWDEHLARAAYPEIERWVREQVAAETRAAAQAIGDSRGEIRDQIRDVMLADLRASRPAAAPDPEEEQAASDLADVLMPVIQAALAAAGHDAVDARQDAEYWQQRAEQAEAALRDLTDTRPCDPHPGTGYCQTHGERPPCPHGAAMRLLAALDQPTSPEETR